MKLFSRILAVVLCLMLCVPAFAEQPATVAPETPDDTVVATVAGKDITWADAKMYYNSLVSSYGQPTQESLSLFQAVALDSAVTKAVMDAKSAELQLDQFTDDEKAAITAQAESDWENALTSYVSQNHPELNDESSEEDKKAAREEAVAYFNAQGFDSATLPQMYLDEEIQARLQALMVQDAVVTDEEVEVAYQEQLAADKELYENDIAAYEAYNQNEDMNAYMSMMYGSSYTPHYAAYKPNGYRAVKHILIEVDEDLMTAYTDLQARLEEQSNDTEAAEGAEAADEAEAAAEPVTEEMVAEAKAAVLASRAVVIDDINTRLAAGEDFDKLIEEYGSDPGMTNEPTKTTGYEVSAVSTSYVKEFVDAAMSIDEVGGISAPYLSDYGIHIVKYIADVEGGPIPMSDSDRAARKQEMLSEKQSELYYATMEQWVSEAQITYTGAVATVKDLGLAD